MLRRPRVWLYAAGGWLLLAGVLHMAAHVWAFVLERGPTGGQRGLAIAAMKQAFTVDPLQPSLWNIFRAFSVSFGFLLIFAGLVDLTLAWTRAEARTVRDLALVQTLLWTIAAMPFLFLDPVIQPIATAVVAVPLHGVAYLTAAAEAQAG